MPNNADDGFFLLLLFICHRASALSFIMSSDLSLKWIEKKEQPFIVSHWEYKPLFVVLHINFVSHDWHGVSSLSSSHFGLHWMKSIRYHETPITQATQFSSLFQLPYYAYKAFPLTACFLIGNFFLRISWKMKRRLKHTQKCQQCYEKWARLKSKSFVELNHLRQRDAKEVNAKAKQKKSDRKCRSFTERMQSKNAIRVTKWVVIKINIEFVIFELWIFGCREKYANRQ